MGVERIIDLHMPDGLEFRTAIQNIVILTLDDLVLGLYANNYSVIVFYRLFGIGATYSIDSVQLKKTLPMNLA